MNNDTVPQKVESTTTHIQLGKTQMNKLFFRQKGSTIACKKQKHVENTGE